MDEEEESLRRAGTLTGGMVSCIVRQPEVSGVER